MTSHPEASRSHSQRRAPLPVPSELTELASGVDALYLSGRAEPPEELLDRLATARESAQELDEPVEFLLDGIPFQLSPFGWQKYTYSLDHSWGRLGIRKNGRLPAIRVQARAEALHGVSPTSVVEFFDEVVTAAVGPVEWSVSRIDLFVDVQGLELTPELGRLLRRTIEAARAPTPTASCAPASSSATASPRRSSVGSTTRPPTWPARAPTG